MKIHLSIVLLLWSVLGTLSLATSKNHQMVLDKTAQDWVNQHLQKMNLEQKVGQLLVPSIGSYSPNLSSEKLQRIEQSTVGTIYQHETY